MKDLLRYGIDEGFISFYIFEHEDKELGLGGRVYTTAPLRVRVEQNEDGHTLTIINEHNVHWSYSLDQKVMKDYGTMVENEDQAATLGLLWKDYNRELAEEMKQITALLA